MTADRTLTAERLREVLAYNPNTGQFSRDGRVVPGSRAGRGGRRQLCIDGRMFYAHRLAWLYVHGEWPAAQIDHINGDVDDNRMANLRLATNAQNAQNRRSTSRNRAGRVGVTYDRRSGRRPWRARIMTDGRMVSLGHFATADEAVAAYEEAKRRMHPFWARAA